MTKEANDVVITGIGLITSAGVGHDAHKALLTDKFEHPTVETERFAPYIVHPMPAIDWSEQIPRRGDQRQMENWQRLGVFAAGLALDDACFKEDAEGCATMDMIVAAAGGERDQTVDSMIIDEAAMRNDHETLLNEKLTTELRPTLFLAQLSNLLAGNISIVHKVTGSSRTFMGEEAAGISAVETAYARLRAGQSTHALVGGAMNAERSDMLLLIEAIGGLATGEWQPLWSRDADHGGGVVLGSGAVFLVLETRANAERRSATIYATIEGVAGDRGPREEEKLARRLRRLADDTGAGKTAPLIMSGASGMIGITATERRLLDTVFPSAIVRGYAGATGHFIEAAFPLGIALAALALKGEARVPAFDPKAETAMDRPSSSAIVTTFGHGRGEGIAVLSAEG